MTNIAVLDYGIGNLRSAQKSLERAGAIAELTADPEIIARADGVVLPGVGAFGACMAAMERTGLDTRARSAADSGRPFLGICVGMQLLYEASAETPGVVGLGILEGVVERLGDGVKHPQMQWNTLSCESHPLLDGLDGEWMYFVHSYVVVPENPATVIARTHYGAPVVAAVAKNNVWATQFHPEKSAEAGHKLISNWVAWVDKMSRLKATT